MQWTKRGCIFNVDGKSAWSAHHAQVPTPYLVDRDRLRIYFASRDQDNRSRPSFFDVDPEQPSKQLALHDRPVLELGELGTFDDSGVMPSSLVEADGELRLYYIGWNAGVTVPYRLAIGLAISNDGGTTFERAFDGAIVDRNAHEPHMAASPYVLRDGGRWRMWYVSGTKWVVSDDRPEPVYVIKHAESDDGIEWRRDGATVVEPNHPDEAFARPWVLKDGDTYRMWFSSRDSSDYRQNADHSYRIGYAESADGVSWKRLDDEVGITHSEDGWDSQMTAYPAIYEYRGVQHLLYNGNGFGQTGIGHATAAA